MASLHRDAGTTPAWLDLHVAPWRCRYISRRKEATVGSYLTRRTLTIDGIDFTFSIEAHFWICFEDIATSRATTADRLAQSIVTTPIGDHLASTIRTYVLAHFQRQSRAPGHAGAIEFEAAPTSAADAAMVEAPPRWLN
jgi:predicted DNA-binding ribbon-helix-helix protein